MKTVRLGRRDYLPVFHAMQAFNDRRTADTEDELWIVEHNPVFTQGLAGKAEHLLVRDDIPVVQIDRGGQITYHGPGQLVVYTMIDFKRRKTSVRRIVSALENSIIATLAAYGIAAAADPACMSAEKKSPRSVCASKTARSITASPSMWTWTSPRSPTSTPAATPAYR